MRGLCCAVSGCALESRGAAISEDCSREHGCRRSGTLPARAALVEHGMGWTDVYGRGHERPCIGAFGDEIFAQSDSELPAAHGSPRGRALRAGMGGGNSQEGAGGILLKRNIRSPVWGSALFVRK